jgi:hypothetical protein
MGGPANKPDPSSSTQPVSRIPHKPAAKLCRMPLDLTAAELETAARACRAMAYQEGERAKKLENPTMRGPIEAAVQRYAALVEKFEAARKRA